MDDKVLEDELQEKWHPRLWSHWVRSGEAQSQMPQPHQRAGVLRGRGASFALTELSASILPPSLLASACVLPVGFPVNSEKSPTPI